MIVVDSTVWIDFFNGVGSEQVRRLRSLFGEREILVGDLILCEVLQGFRSERDAGAARRALAAFDFAPMVGREIALKAAANDRALRRRGIPVRQSAVRIGPGTGRITAPTASRCCGASPSSSPSSGPPRGRCAPSSRAPAGTSASPPPCSLGSRRPERDRPAGHRLRR